MPEGSEIRGAEPPKPIPLGDIKPLPGSTMEEDIKAPEKTEVKGESLMKLADNGDPKAALERMYAEVQKAGGNVIAEAQAKIDGIIGTETMKSETQVS